jgi:hypothetical protein
MSPRAAWRLESIGFAEVHDYVAGKADWGSAGPPLEGTRGSDTRVGAYLRRDVPCGVPKLCSHRRIIAILQAEAASSMRDVTTRKTERLTVGWLRPARLPKLTHHVGY